MVQTTGQINGCNSKLEIDDDGGTPIDVSGSANSITIDFTNQVGEGFTFDGRFPLRAECKEDASLSGTIFWTSPTDEARDILDLWRASKGLRTVIFSPQGGNPGDVQYRGEYFLTSLSFTTEASSADPVTVDFECMPSGEVFTESVGS